MFYWRYRPIYSNSIFILGLILYFQRVYCCVLSAFIKEYDDDDDNDDDLYNIGIGREHNYVANV